MNFADMEQPRRYVLKLHTDVLMRSRRPTRLRYTKEASPMKKGAKKIRDGRIHPALDGKIPKELLNQESNSEYHVTNHHARTYYFLDGRRTSEKRVKELLGKEEYLRALATARVLHYRNQDGSFNQDTPQGILTISFKYI